LFECFRKLALVSVPIAFEVGSNSQLITGLVICFLAYGVYCMFAPYEGSDDDVLAQLAQIVIFFSLVASLILNGNPSDTTMRVLLPALLSVVIIITVCLMINVAMYTDANFNRHARQLLRLLRLEESRAHAKPGSIAAKASLAVQAGEAALTTSESVPAIVDDSSDKTVAPEVVPSPPRLENVVPEPSASAPLTLTYRRGSKAALAATSSTVSSDVLQRALEEH
jgi:hypothetical protein